MLERQHALRLKLIYSRVSLLLICTVASLSFYSENIEHDPKLSELASSRC